ncbi:MAG: response regulator transcription factor [Anaerolineales bacterium]|jgi:YesN/AraC family two-component response regulator|nr:response regulator transcription factor [Anaerolineales bacterium]MBK9781698.1 response regulator transcription factor [Anaerolineales bacterium]
MQPKLKKKKVLIADDAHETRRSTRLMLSMVEEVEVVAIALDGTQAIEMAQQRKPDIVILDLNMPRVNGLAAYKKIVAENPHTACIIISAEKDPKSVQTALDMGIEHYLIKPFTADELENAVRAIVHKLGREEVNDPAPIDNTAELRKLADEYIQTKRTDEEAVRVFEELLPLPDCELRWVQTLAMIYVVRQRWSKLKALTELMQQRTK